MIWLKRIFGFEGRTALISGFGAFLALYFILSFDWHEHEYVLWLIFLVLGWQAVRPVWAMYKSRRTDTPSSEHLKR